MLKPPALFECFASLYVMHYICINLLSACNGVHAAWYFYSPEWNYLGLEIREQLTEAANEWRDVSGGMSMLMVSVGCWNTFAI